MSRSRGDYLPALGLRQAPGTYARCMPFWSRDERKELDKANPHVEHVNPKDRAKEYDKARAEQEEELKKPKES